MRAFGNLETPRYPEIDLAKNRRAQVDSFQHLPDNVHCRIRRAWTLGNIS